MSELKTNLQSILQEKTEKIISQNIKKNVEVLGVTGSYDKEDIKELEAELADAQNELATVRRDLDNSTATISGNGEIVTLNGTAEARFKKPPLPMGNSEQVQYSGKNKFNVNNISASSRLGDAITNNEDGSKIFIKNGLGENGIPLGKISDLCPTLQIGDVIKVYFETNAVRGGVAVNYIYLSVVASTLSKTQTIEVTQNVLDSQVFIYAGQTENVYYNNFMILLSSEADISFEPYVRTELQALHLIQTIHKK